MSLDSACRFIVEVPDSGEQSRAPEYASRAVLKWKVSRAYRVTCNAIGRHPCLDDSVVIPCESMWVTNFIGRDVDGVETGL